MCWWIHQSEPTHFVDVIQVLLKRKFGLEREFAGWFDYSISDSLNYIWTTTSKRNSVAQTWMISVIVTIMIMMVMACRWLCWATCIGCTREVPDLSSCEIDCFRGSYVPSAVWAFAMQLRTCGLCGMIKYWAWLVADTIVTPCTLK